MGNEPWVITITPLSVSAAAKRVACKCAPRPGALAPSAVSRLKPHRDGGRGGCPSHKRRALWRALLPAPGLHVEFHQALGPRDLALDHASLIRLALIRQGKNLPHGIRPIQHLRHWMP